MNRQMVFGALVALLAVFATQADVAGAQGLETAVTGKVPGILDQGFMGASVDLYTEDRESYLDSTTTGPDGTFRFEVEPGCYSITVTAPEGFGFSLSPIRGFGPYWNAQTCVAEGESAELVSRTLTRIDSRFGPRVDVAVTDSSGEAVPDVVFDLFTAGPNGERDAYLFSRFTDTDGISGAAFDVPGCYVLTFIAPDDQTFVESGSEWLNVPICAGVGEIVSVSATVATGDTAEEAAIGGVATEGDKPFAGLTVDLFDATSDGSRGTFLGDTATADDGRFVFETRPGCYVLTFVAPVDRTFTSTGTQWTNRWVCVEPGESVTTIDAELALQ